MNTLKMGPAGYEVSIPEGYSHGLVDRELQHSSAASALARGTRQQSARSMESSPRVQTLAKPKSLRVAIKVRGKILFINLGDVVAIQAKGNSVWVQQNSSSYLMRESISVVAEMLEAHGFIRIHRSVLVNTSFVEEISPLSTGEYSLRVEGGKEYTVTRTYKKNLKCLAELWIGTGALWNPASR